MTLLILFLLCLALMALPYALMILGAILPYVLAAMACMWLLHACC